MAQISSITPSDSFEGFTFTLAKAAPILDDCTIGDSISVNGACLTVTSFSADEKDQGGWFKVGLANETLRRTNLGELKLNGWVNCERAMGGKTRFGGHMVQVIKESSIITIRGGFKWLTSSSYLTHA